VPAGHRLIEQGRHDQQVFYLLSGAVDVIRDGNTADRIYAGDVVGEYAFIDNRSRTASVVTVETVDLIELDRDTLMRNTDVDFLARFLGFLGQRMESREGGWGARQGAHEFVERLTREALQHRAVTHSYLSALETGAVPDLRWALGDFAKNYYGYSAHFPRYLAQTISQLTDPTHRSALLENLTEESGHYAAEDLEVLARAGVDPEWIVGIPHPELFGRFCKAMGVHLGEPTDDALEVLCWREMYLDVLRGSPAQAIGALGLGTEAIVHSVYQHFLPVLAKLEVEPRDAVFFPLHTIVDDHHQHTLRQIAIDFAATPQGRIDLEKGMRKALFLRSGFWDWLWERAQNPPADGADP
jgi:CRP-like cAMP-binding protein